MPIGFPDQYITQSIYYVLWMPAADLEQRWPQVPVMAQTGAQRAGRACPLCPGISDINLFRYCEGIIHFDAEISDRALDLCMSEQKLDGPERLPVRR